MACSTPRSRSRSTFRSPSATMSSLVPHAMAFVGHVFTHAGSRPASTRSTHMLHL